MISIEGDADPVTLSLIRQVLAAAPGKVDLFVQAARPVSQPSLVRLVVENEAIEPLETSPAPAGSIVARLVELAAFHTGLTIELLLGGGRAARLARVRGAVVLVAREQGGLSLPAIGRALGGRDHSGIIHALRRAEERMAADPAFRLLVARLRAGLEEKIDG